MLLGDISGSSNPEDDEELTGAILAFFLIDLHLDIVAILGGRRSTLRR